MQGLASSTLVGCYLYMRRRYSVDPAAVYRLAMLRLNTDPGILEVRVPASCLCAAWMPEPGLACQSPILKESSLSPSQPTPLPSRCPPLGPEFPFPSPAAAQVMGAPITGSNLRATVTTGGGLRFRGLRPRVQAKRLQMIFPLKGSERRGLVSLEAKKRRVSQRSQAGSRREFAQLARPIEGGQRDGAGPAGSSLWAVSGLASEPYLAGAERRGQA